ncbi:MAG: hypothetical protein BAJALOKI3v1_100033 [Promethearchaeota archaeon]|nr:MAG: hypothetical protein BAJALOKI3v1_100033 [Candidatus Lokiarchaeota archaeon]
MKGIEGIYIINKRGTSIFSYNLSKEKNRELNYSMLANLFSALKNFELKTGENGINSLKVRKNCFYFIKDDFTENFIVAKCTSKTKSNETTEILLEIKFQFIKKYMKQIYVKQNPIHLNANFRKTIKNVLEKDIKRKEMLNSLEL